MATSYTEITELVHDWANRDPSVLPDNIVQSGLRYAADEAYRMLEIPPLEHSTYFVLNLTGAAESYVDEETVVLAPNINVGDLDRVETQTRVNRASIPVPGDAISFIHLRVIGRAQRDENNRVRVVNRGTITNPNYEPMVSTSDINAGVVFNEKTDIRTYYDFFADKTAFNFWTRQGSNLLLAGDISADTVIELHYYRRLPALNARTTVPTSISRQLAPYTTAPDGYEIATLEERDAMTLLDQRTYTEVLHQGAGEVTAQTQQVTLTLDPTLATTAGSTVTTAATAEVGRFDVGSGISSLIQDPSLNFTFTATGTDSSGTTETQMITVNSIDNPSGGNLQSDMVFWINNVINMLSDYSSTMSGNTVNYTKATAGATTGLTVTLTRSDGGSTATFTSNVTRTITTPGLASQTGQQESGTLSITGGPYTAAPQSTITLSYNFPAVSGGTTVTGNVTFSSFNGTVFNTSDIINAVIDAVRTADTTNQIRFGAVSGTDTAQVTYTYNNVGAPSAAPTITITARTGAAFDTWTSSVTRDAVGTAGAVYTSPSLSISVAPNSGFAFQTTISDFPASSAANALASHIGTVLADLSSPTTGYTWTVNNNVIVGTAPAGFPQPFEAPTAIIERQGSSNFAGNLITFTETRAGVSPVPSIEAGGRFDPRQFIRSTTEVPNWLKDQNERVLLFGALFRCFDYLQEDQQAQKYQARFMEAMNELNMEEKKRKASGGNIQINYNGFGQI